MSLSFWQCCLVLSAGKLPFTHAPPDDRELPDMHMALYNTVIVFDQATKLAYVITWVHLDRHASLEEAYQHGQHQLQTTSRKIENEHSPNLTNGKVLPCAFISCIMPRVNLHDIKKFCHAAQQQPG